MSRSFCDCDCDFLTHVKKSQRFFALTLHSLFFFVLFFFLFCFFLFCFFFFFFPSFFFSDCFFFCVCFFLQGFQGFRKEKNPCFFRGFRFFVQQKRVGGSGGTKLKVPFPSSREPLSTGNSLLNFVRRRLLD